MKVKNMIELAREGNYLGFEYLDAHYSPLLKNNVRKKYGEEASEKMFELIPSLIKYYIENNIKDSLSSFLNKEADAIFGKDDKKEVIGSEINVHNQKKFELIVKHYSNSFYNRILKYNNILSDEELKKFSYFFIKINLTRLSNSDADIRSMILNRMIKEENYYICDRDKLLKRYIMLVGINDNILNYYLDKYSYLIEKYKNNRMYNCLVSNYKDIVCESLVMITRINCNIENLIINNLNSRYFLTINSIKTILSSEKYNENDYKLICQNYSYIKGLIYNKFKEKTYLSDEELRSQINIKYEDYVKAYLNSKKNSNIGSYINTRLTKFFNGYVGKKHDKDFYKTEEYYGYEYYIYKILGKLHACYPCFLAEKELKETYDEYFKTKYLKQRKTDTKEAVRRSLMRRIDKLNVLYQEQNIRDMASKYKRTILNDVLEKEILNNVIDNLVSYYISMGINNKETFESLLINTLLNFDKTVYEDLDRLKKQEQCKVLNRHKN